MKMLVVAGDGPPLSRGMTVFGEVPEMKEKLLVICPGRGTYNATELGYLKRPPCRWRRAWSRSSMPIAQARSADDFGARWC
jgi:hypothetical protein